MVTEQVSSEKGDLHEEHSVGGKRERFRESYPSFLKYGGEG